MIIDNILSTYKAKKVSQTCGKLSISPAYYNLPESRQTCQIDQAAKSWLTSGYLHPVIQRLVALRQLALQQSCFDNQLATSLLTTCDRLDNKLSQAM